MNTVCPVCEAGHLTAEKYEAEIEHNGSKLIVRDLERCRCDVCGADPVLTDQIRRNQVRIADARRMADGLLRADEIRAARDVMQISQSQAAEIFGGGANAFSKYERGEVLQSLAMDRLLRIARDVPGVLQYLATCAGVAVGSIASTGYVETIKLTANVPAAPSRRHGATLVIVCPNDYKKAA